VWPPTADAGTVNVRLAEQLAKLTVPRPRVVASNSNSTWPPAQPAAPGVATHVAVTDVPTWPWLGATVIEAPRTGDAIVSRRMLTTTSAQAIGSRWRRGNPGRDIEALVSDAGVIADIRLETQCTDRT
jgi:hypothetical protein